MAIKRIWQGATTQENADAYQRLLLAEIIPGIEATEIPGLRSIEVLRRDHGDEVEFVTVMTFDSMDGVIAFKGEDYERSHVPEAAQRVLARWDRTSAHYEVAATRTYG